MPTGFDIPKIVCAGALGMENGKIPDSSIMASSRYNQWWGPERGRLNEQKEGIGRISLCSHHHPYHRHRHSCHHH